MISDEYQAAVNLGYISKSAAEKECSRMDINNIDRENTLQRKAFFAGFLFLSFKFGWDLTEKDMSDARSAWDLWCNHQDKQQ